eukprot:401778-Prorocentrum_minimum.AAC.1
MVERGTDGRAASTGKLHAMLPHIYAGHTKQAERLHEVAVTVGKLDALIHPACQLGARCGVARGA